MQQSDSKVDGLSLAEAVATPRFSEWALRRLARLHAHAMGAQEVAEVSGQAARSANARFQEALAEACDEIGVSLPPGPMQANIDWRTGAFSFEAPPQGAPLA